MRVRLPVFQEIFLILFEKISQREKETNLDSCSNSKKNRAKY